MTTVVVSMLILILTPAFNSINNLIYKHDPDDIRIIRSIDSTNEDLLRNGNTTASPTIKLYFEAYKGTTVHPNSDFECKIDRDTFSSCSSPETLTSLPLGQHNFHVRVIDPNANKTPKSADFAFNIIPSVIIKGVLLVNGFSFRDTKLMMDDRFNHTTDSSGQFNFVNINILKDMQHNSNFL